MRKTNVTLVRSTLEHNGFRDTPSTDWTICWSGQHVRPSVLQRMKPHQWINHWPRSYEASRKDRLCHNVSRMASIKGKHHFGFLPETFILPDEYQTVCETLEAQFGYLDPHTDVGLFIIKPQASSRGRGIEVVRKFGQIPTSGKNVLSRYIPNPLLIDGLKFDLRIFVTVLSFDPLRIYLHEQGLARFATEKFRDNVKGAAAKYMHLTNYSINKHNPRFKANKDAEDDGAGSKWSLPALYARLASMGVDTARVQAEIEDIVIKTFIAIEPAVSSACHCLGTRARCFELYGFDILLDAALKPWLLEVNFSPSLGCDTPLDLKIKSTVLADLFSLLGVNAQPPAPADQRAMKGVGQFVNKVRPATRHSPLRLPKISDPLRPPTEQVVSRQIRQLRLEGLRAARGGWKRIFPTETSAKYLRLFEIKRASDEAAITYLLNRVGSSVSGAFGGMGRTSADVTAIRGFSDRGRPKSVPHVRRVSGTQEVRRTARARQPKVPVQ